MCCYERGDKKWVMVRFEFLEGNVIRLSLWDVYFCNKMVFLEY